MSLACVYETPPLCVAVSEGRKEVSALLITKGADANTTDKHGQTPLNYAVNFKYTEIADLLRKHGGKTGE